jgi:hypothetical protein
LRRELRSGDELTPTQEIFPTRHPGGVVSIAGGLVAIALAAVALLDPPSARAQCVGDCSEDSRVTIAELVLGTNLALGVTPVGDCPAADRDDDGAVSIDELVIAVHNSLIGCPEPTETPTLDEPTATPTETPSPTPTPTLAGPVVTFFGAILADNSIVDPVGMEGDVPIYQFPFGFGFIVVVEAKRGPSGESPGPSTFQPSGVPDLQIAASRTLGNGSATVCDARPPNAGGVPELDFHSLDDTAAVSDALNDFGCRFVDGEGLRQARSCAEGCVRFETGELGCVVQGAPSVASTQQYCAAIDTPMEFPPGDTLLTVRLRDLEGALGAIRQMILRVVPP